MSVRLRCSSCRTAFVLGDDPARRRVTCPKCGTVQGVPRPKPAPAPAVAVVEEPAVESVFIPSGAPRRSRRGWVFATVGLLTLVAAGVVVVVAWPAIVRWWKPVPLDPVESVATTYLRSLISGDREVSSKLGTVDLPPAIGSFRSLKRDRGANARLRGSYAPLAAFHARVDSEYSYDPSADRFVPKNALGPAAETLDAVHAAKEKAEKEGLYKKMQSGDPEDLFDAAESLGKTFSSLAEGVLAPRKLLPTYRMLVEDAKPPLPPTEKALALDFAANRETWDALLRRPFLSLKADGPYVLDRAEVSAKVIDALGSSGDPPTTLRLTLTRFRLEGIDTGWRVTSARRGDQAAPPAPAPTPRPETAKSYSESGRPSGGAAPGP